MCAWILVDGIGLASTRGSYGLRQTMTVSPSSQQATLAWDNIRNKTQVVTMVSFGCSGAVW